MLRPMLRPMLCSMLRAPRLCLLGAALLLAGCSDKAKVREPAELIDIEAPAFSVDTVWTASVGEQGGNATDLGLALQADGVFAASADGHVTALDPATGKRLWKVRVGGNLQAGPALAGNAVLVGSRDAIVIALSRADGSELWRAKLSSEVLGAPAGDGEVVVVRTVDGWTYGLSADTGTRLWAFDRAVPSLVLRGMSPPLLVAGRTLIGMDNGRVAALSASDGTVLWEQTVSVPQGRTELDRMTDIDGPLVDGPGCVYAASFGGQVACIELITGQAVWRRDVKSYSGLAFANDKLFVSDESSVVWGLDARSGAAAWKQEGLLYRGVGSPAVLGGYVVVADREGYLHWLDPADGHPVARSRAGNEPIYSSMLVSDELLYAVNDDGKLRALALTP